MNRRNFLKATGIAGTALALAPLSMFRHVPTIYGDGIHDDLEGLQAYIDGKEVRWMYGSRADLQDNSTVACGRFKVSDTLHVRNGANSFSNCTFMSDVQPLIVAHGDSVVNLSESLIIFKQQADRAAA